ncbi:MAG: ABC transporter substrate-binding protein [Pseudorhodoplanes sp.]
MKAKKRFAPVCQGMSRRTLLLAGASGVALGVSSSARAQTPKKGGRLRTAIQGGATTDTFDPGKYNDTYWAVVGMGGLRNNLTEISADNKVTPELAESWEVSKDAKTWTFRLRQGVQFHSGKTMTADDVKASFEHHMGPNTTSVAKGVLTAVENVTAVDPRTIRFQLKFGNADFPALITDFHLGIMPAKDGKADWQSGDGTGGYKVAKFDPGVRMLMSRNPNYWKSGAAHFDEVEALAVSDVAARQNALLSGEVDVIDRIDLKTTDLLTRNPNIVIENVPGRLHYAYEMNTSNPPFNNNDIRLAIKYAIDRQALLDKILFGYGTLGNDNPISSTYPYFNKALAQRTYDPDKAKFHLKKANQSTVNIDLSVSDVVFNGATDSCVLFKEQAAKAGININVVRESPDGYWSKVWGKRPFATSYYTGRPTEDGTLSLAFIKGAGMNTVNWDNARVNELVAAARAELDTGKRAEMYGEVQQIIRDEGAFIIPVFGNYVFARSKKLSRGPNISAERSLDGARLTERWWFS